LVVPELEDASEDDEDVDEEELPESLDVAGLLAEPVRPSEPLLELLPLRVSLRESLRESLR